MNILENLGLDSFSAMTLLINLGLAFAILSSLRFILGQISNVDAKDELAEKDNPAFGISLAGVILGVTIMLTGVIYGEPGADYKSEMMAVLGYGVLGVVLMILTKLLFDKIALPNLDVHKEILGRNVSVGLLDAGNVIATAIIVRAVMIWTESVTLDGVYMVLLGYALSQLILLLATIIQRVFYRRHHDHSLQKAFTENKLATAWHFAGYRIGVALAITAATSYVPYAPDDLFGVAITWFALSLLLMFAVSILVWIAERIIFMGIPMRDEIDAQQNTGLAVAHAFLTIAVGILLASLLA